MTISHGEFYIIGIVFFYILTGVIRVSLDFFTKDPYLSAPYVLHPRLHIILYAIIFWVKFPITYLIEQRRRLSFRYKFNYFIFPLLFGSVLYATAIYISLTVFESSDSVLLKVITNALIVIVAILVLGWLAMRRKLDMYKNLSGQSGS